MSSRNEENDMDRYSMILDEFRKKNQGNRRSYEGDMAFTRWTTN